MQTALDQVRSGQSGTDDGASFPDAEVRVVVRAARTTDRPQFWLWAAWEQDRAVPSAVDDVLQGAVDVVESVLSQLHWTYPNTADR